MGFDVDVYSKEHSIVCKRASHMLKGFYKGGPGLPSKLEKKYK